MLESQAQADLLFWFYLSLNVLSNLWLILSELPNASLPARPEKISCSTWREWLVVQWTTATALSIQSWQPISACPMGGCEHLPLDSAWAAYTPDSPEDAQTQCNRGMADDVENRLAEMLSAIVLNRNTIIFTLQGFFIDKCWWISLILKAIKFQVGFALSERWSWL